MYRLFTITDLSVLCPLHAKGISDSDFTHRFEHLNPEFIYFLFFSVFLHVWTALVNPAVSTVLPQSFREETFL